MAYNLVVDTSNFKPFDFTNALAILRDIRDANYKTREEINKILEELGKYTLPEGSKYSEQLNNFWNDFATASENFYNRSNRDTMSAIRNLRSRYNREMIPIREMVNKYNSGLETLAKLGPDAIVANREALNNLDSYYGGLNPQINYQSRKNILTVAAGVMQGLDNALMKAPELAGKIAGLYFSFVQKGMDGNTALKGILQANPQLNTEQGAHDTSELVSALNSVYNLFAFKDGAPENRDIWESVVTGSIMGIQAPKYSLQNDHSYESDALRASREYTELQRDYYRLLKDLEEEEKNLKLGKVKIDDGDGEYHYEYDPKKAKEILDLRRASQEDSPAKVTPHISYGGHRYSVKKVSDMGTGLNTYEVSDIDSGLIITDPSLKKGIVDYYNGINIPSAETPPLTPLTPQPPQTPADSLSAALRGAWTGKK